MCKHISLTLEKNNNLYVRLVFRWVIPCQRCPSVTRYFLTLSLRAVVWWSVVVASLSRTSTCNATCTATSNKSTHCIVGGSTPLLGTKFLRWILPGKFLYKYGVHKGYNVKNTGDTRKVCNTFWSTLEEQQRLFLPLHWQPW